MMDDFSARPEAGSSTDKFKPDAISSSQASLEQGLMALKQKNYPIAIANLKTVCRVTTSQTTRVKAQMGLIKAYAQTGALDAAISLCQPLCDSKQQTIQLWATQTMQELSRRSQTASNGASDDTSNDAGFVPLDQAVLNQSASETSPVLEEVPAEVPAEMEADMTGFMPIQAGTPAKARQTVSMPLDTSSAQSQVQPPLSDRSDPANETELDDETRDTPEDETELDNPFTFSTGGVDWVEPVPEQQDTTPKEDPNQPDQPLDFVPATALKPDRPTATPAAVTSLTWRQAGRAQKWSPLGAQNPAQLWLLQAGTAIALIAAVWLLLQPIVFLLNQILDWITFPVNLSQLAPTNGVPIWLLVVLLGGLFFVTPWLLDLIFQRVYKLQPLSLDELASSSPETPRMLKRVCGQRRFALPTLSLLPKSAPLILTYGWSPQTARIVVSQGLLSQLQDDEIAVLYASQLAHIAHREFAVLSWVTLVALLPHLVYSRVSAWGDRKQDRVLRSITALISALAYGAYRLCRWSGLALARLRLYESDRTATELTGNPNALTRALLKLSIAVAQDVHQQGQTSLLLESCDLLTPVGYRTALSVGCLFPQSPTTELLRWDYSNPYRQWLAVNHAHPPLGDRLYQLSRYARYWHLPTELDWEATQRSQRSVPLRRFLLQAAPYTGLLMGLAIALSLWLVGAVADQADFRPLSWMANDQSILQGCLLMGFSLGTFLRINPFFPDIKAANVQLNPSLVELVSNPTQLPVDSQPVRLHGKLLGRKGIPACLNQDLLLETETGIIRLHFTSQWGWIGNLAAQSPRPQDWHRNPVVVTGWFHRGVTPWIEVETIQSQRSTVLKSNAPLLLTYLAGLAALLGAYIIANG
jgi:Zn-dependent protease with chaperone function